MQQIEKIPSKRKWPRFLLAAVFFIGCIVAGGVPVEAQPPPVIDFSITKTMLPERYGSVQGDVITFIVTGTMPYPASGLTGTLTFPGQVWITDTIPGGLTLGGFTAPPGWECQPVTITLPPPGGNGVAWTLPCQSPRQLSITRTMQFPVVITSTVATSETLTLTQTARISATPGVITDTNPVDPNPSNNIVEVPFEVNRKDGKESPPLAAVPTLGEWGMAIFIVLLGVAMVVAIRKKKFN